MTHSPLDQFKLSKIYELSIFGYDVSFTNSSLFMILVMLGISSFCLISLAPKKILPTRSQYLVESLFGFIEGMIDDNIGREGRKFTPLIFSIFLFILLCNLLGMLPYSFTVTSHLSITFALAMLIFMLVTIYGFIRHGVKFLSLFLPDGTPWWLVPLMIPIELFAYLARPVSLSLRLAVNMIAGHVLLKVIASFVIMLGLYLKWLPIPLMVALVGFEIFVSILQAYIFTILSCVYLNDAVNLH